MRQRLWSEKYPDLGTSPLPTEPYISEEHFALERERVFRRSWLQVGRVEEIPRAGAYFVRDIDICNASVLVLRGSDGVVRGFHNVCSHRSNRLVADERGSCGGALFCRFHNWAYSDRGELVGVPDEENFFGLDKREHGLTPVDTDVWEGFVFVHLAPDPAETLREYLGGVADRLDGCRFHEMELSQVYRVEERANWKVVLDAQNEVYHLPYQHRWTLGTAFAKNDTGNCRFKEVILFDYHSFWSCDYRSFQDLTPLKIALFFGGDGAGAFRVPNMIGDLDHYLLFPNGILSLFKVGRWMGVHHIHVVADRGRPDGLGDPDAFQCARIPTRTAPAGIFQVRDPGHASGGYGGARKRPCGHCLPRADPPHPAGQRTADPPFPQGPGRICRVRLMHVAGLAERRQTAGDG